jgi:hypothetical protein
MPTILLIGPYRFFFFAGDGDAPPHIHAEHEGKAARFWLAPVRLQYTGGFGRAELNRLQKLVEENQDEFLAGLDDFFNG